MIKRCVEISSGPTRLSLRLGQLIIDRRDEEPVSVPIEDLGVLIIDQPFTSYSHGALTALAENNVAVVLSGHDHHPAAILLPAEANSLQAEAIAAQASATRALKNRLWREIVRAKLRAQAAMLERFGRGAEGLRNLALKVRSGDPKNLEAQGAQRYWRSAMGPGFRRARDGLPPNSLLNYGYMVLRAATARAVCGAGLSPSLGLHHRNRYNAFVLADDLMEPLRPAVDVIVRTLWDEGEAELTREVRARILEILTASVGWKDGHSPLFVALTRYAASVREVLARKRVRPDIPMPILQAPEESRR